MQKAIQQIKLLVNLARKDGEISEREKNLIMNVGQANHMLAAEILPLLSAEHPTVMPENLTDNEKFEYLSSLVRLMKIDELLYPEEIKYCARVASRLGYDEMALFELMLRINHLTPQEEIDALKGLKAS